MCIAFFGYNLQNSLPLVLASNRDEFWDRPTAPLHQWEDEDPQRSSIVAGKDLQGGGTWLAIHDKNHRLAFVTNYRESLQASTVDHPPSRGKLVTDFLIMTDQDEFISHLEKDGHLYSGFNLVFGNRKHGFYFFSNRSVEKKVVTLQPNRIYGVSNGYLDEPWPKLNRGKHIFCRVLDENNITPNRANGDWSNLREGLWKLLTDEWKPPEIDLPSTGVSMEFERILSSIFVQAPQFDYGTRCSTLILGMPNGKCQIQERTYRRRDNTSGPLNPNVDFDEKSFVLGAWSDTTKR